MSWYKRNGDSLAKLANPADAPTASITGYDWSPDGTCLAISISGGVALYSCSGDTLAKLANPASMLIGVNRGPCWSPDGTYLAVGSTTSPYLAVYKKEGTAFSRLANPAVLPPAAVYGNAWSPGGNQLIAVSYAAGNAVSAYEFEGGALGSSTTLPFAYGRCAAFGATSS
jgi:WD40 repeat protein